MERFPLNPEERNAEDAAARAAVLQEQEEAAAQRHQHAPHSLAPLAEAGADAPKQERLDSLQRTSETESTTEAELQVRRALVGVR